MIDLRANPFFLSERQEKEVHQMLASMSKEDKIHQLFCVLGDACDADQLEKLARENIGGILFRPVRTAGEIAADYNRLEALAAYPLLRAANLEEGGAGASGDGTYFANQIQVAASQDEEDIHHFAACCAQEGIRAGVNWTFSPVSDLDLNFRNPITNCRTFGSDPETVRRLTTVYVQDIQSSGIAACAKHFPGDGVDFRDQHLHPTYNRLSAEEWRKTYGAVYRGMIEKGLLSVMAGHICQPAMEMEYENIQLEECLPGSMSKGLISGVLRKELGFNGVVCTDATIMGGYTMPMPRKKSIPATFNAGVDMIVFSTDIEEDLDYVRQALSDGTLSMQRIDEAVTRILALKAIVCSSKKATLVPAREWQEACADHAVTLVKDLDHLLPITPKRYPHIRLQFCGQEECWEGSVREMLREALMRRGFEVENYEPLTDELHGTASLPQERLTLLALHYPHASNQVTVRPAWCAKHALEIPRFVHEEAMAAVSFANPYHLQDLPRVRTFINAYTATWAAVEATVAKLCGESTFTGVSPVDAFCALQDTHL